jgi:hypothetical protein
LYDGLNAVQELSAGGVSANILGDLDLDEYFVRTDISGTVNYLMDAMGSTVALTAPNGAIQVEYKSVAREVFLLGSLGAASLPIRRSQRSEHERTGPVPHPRTFHRRFDADEEGEC